MWEKQEYEMPTDVLFVRPAKKSVGESIKNTGKTVRKVKQKEKNQRGIQVIILQSILSTVAVGVVLIIRVLNPILYDDLKNNFKYATQYQLSQPQQQLAADIADGAKQEVFSFFAGINQKKQKADNPEEQIQQSQSEGSQSVVVDDRLLPETKANLEPAAEEPPVFSEAQGGGEYVIDGLPSQTIADKEYSLTRKLALPIDSGWLSSRFGSRISPINGKPEFHSGVDIAAPAGTAVKSVASGIITAVGSDPVSGNYIKIDHFEGLQSIYCHLKKTLVAEGSVVMSGEKIAIIGSTGASTGIHLHLIFVLGGERVNPLQAYPEGIYG